MSTHRVPRERKGCLAPLLALVVLLVLVAVGYVWGIGFIKDRVEGPDDYSGTGTGKVRVQVDKGQTSTDIASTLRKADVVKSVEAFVDAANDDQQSLGIQPGYYNLRHKMSAKAALAILVNPKNRVATSVTIPEGKWADEVVDIVAAQTKFTKKELNAVLARPRSIGLPAYAHGKVEGFLFPDTYEITPTTTARSLLKSMVDLWKQKAREIGLARRARALGYTPYQVLTVASIAQAEVTYDKDLPKVARVIYNRLGKYHMTLGMDTTILYHIKKRGGDPSQADLEDPEPYNTRINQGLPPTPIDNPGLVALKAALHPTPGDWAYFITVNLDTKETKFTRSYQQFLQYNQDYQQYCTTSKLC